MDSPNTYYETKTWNTERRRPEHPPMSGQAYGPSVEDLNKVAARKATQEVPVERESEIFRELGHLEEMVYRLENSVAALECQLAPVLSFMEASVDPRVNSISTGPTTTVGQSVHKFTNKLGDLQKQIESVKVRLGI